MTSTVSHNRKSYNLKKESNLGPKVPMKNMKALIPRNIGEINPERKHRETWVPMVITLIFPLFSTGLDPSLTGVVPFQVTCGIHRDVEIILGHALRISGFHPGNRTWTPWRCLLIFCSQGETKRTLIYTRWMSLLLLLLLQFVKRSNLHGIVHLHWNTCWCIYIYKY